VEVVAATVTGTAAVDVDVVEVVVDPGEGARVVVEDVVVVVVVVDPVAGVEVVVGWVVEVVDVDVVVVVVTGVHTAGSAPPIFASRAKPGPGSFR